MDLASAESQRATAGADDDDAEYYRQEVGEEPEHGKYSQFSFILFNQKQFPELK